MVLLKNSEIDTYVSVHVISWLKISAAIPLNYA